MQINVLKLPQKWIGKQYHYVLFRVNIIFSEKIHLSHLLYFEDLRSTNKVTREGSSCCAGKRGTNKEIYSWVWLNDFFEIGSIKKGAKVMRNKDNPEINTIIKRSRELFESGLF